MYTTINRQIADEYSNYYIDIVPMTTDKNAMKFNLNYIDINKLVTLANVDSNAFYIAIYNY